MSKLFFSLLFAAFAITAQAGNPVAGQPIKVNTADSKILWTASKVTGQHNGSVAIKDGNLEMKDGLLTGGSFTMDLRSITVLDLEGKGKENLEGHLKSDDFFGVEKFPTSQLVITDAKLTGSGVYNIKANLTIKGITHPIEFVANVKPEGAGVKATADIKVDRTMYDVRYGSGKFFDNLGDKAIFDEFNLAVSLVAGA